MLSIVRIEDNAPSLRGGRWAMPIFLAACLALRCSNGDAPTPSAGGGSDSGEIDSGSLDEDAAPTDALGTDPVVLFDDAKCVGRAIAADLAPPSCDVPLPEESRLPRDYPLSLALGVRARSGPAGDVKIIPRVLNAAACMASVGWFFDDDSKPTGVTLCPVICEALGAPGSTMDFLIGCSLVLTPPP